VDQVRDMSREEATSLDYVRQMWADKYKIDFFDGIWRASRHGRPVFGNSVHTAITAATAEELRNLITDDYRQWAAEARRAR
jgi:hypothetical protein